MWQDWFEPCGERISGTDRSAVLCHKRGSQNKSSTLDGSVATDLGASRQRQCTPGDGAPIPNEQSSQANDATGVLTGKPIFKKNCSFCHGAEGLGASGPVLSVPRW